MYLNETYSEVCVGELLADTFPIHNGLKQGDALSPFFFFFSNWLLQSLSDLGLP
jgi:hypothetical protein